MRFYISALLVMLLNVLLLDAAYCSQQLLVRDIQIDQKAKNSVIAKSLGLKKAEKQAFSFLLYFLYSQAQPKALEFFTHNDISSSVLKFQITEEQISPTRYKALVNYYFDTEKIMRLLSSIDIPSYNENFEDVMIIPTLINNQTGKTSIWETEWFESWNKNSSFYNISVIPENLDNVLIMNSNNNRDVVIEKILKKYKAKEILIANAIVKENGEFEIIIERPLSQQRKKIDFLSREAEFSENFLDIAVKESLEDLYNNFQSPKVSVVQNMDNYYQIALVDNGEWKKVQKLLHKYNYIVQYIANDIIVIELRDEDDVYSLEKNIKKSGYIISKVSNNQWLINTNH